MTPAILQVLLSRRASSAAPVVAALPQQAAIVGRFRTDTLPVVADGTSVASWADMISGQTITQATGASQPTYKLNRFGGKPSLLCNGSQYLAGTITAVNTALTSGEITMFVVYANAQATSFGFLASLTNSTGFNVSNNGTFCGPAVPVLDGAPTGFATGANSLTQNYNALSVSRSPTYVNGQCIGLMATTTYTPTSLGIGAGPTGTGGAKVEILEVIVWNRRLTAYEMIQAQMAVCDYYTQPYPWASTPYIYLGIGDSLSYGYGTSTGLTPRFAWPRLYATRHSIPHGAWANHGYIGATPVTVNTIINGERLKDIATLTGKPVKFSYFEFYNTQGNSNATSVANTQTLLSNIKGVTGNKVGFGTTTDFATRAASKATWTAYWDVSGNRTGYMDAYVALHLDATLGVDGACPSAAPFGHYFKSQVNGPVALTGASITSGTATLTTTNDVLTAGVYVDDARLPTDTYVVTRNSAGNYTLSANAITTITSAAIPATSLNKGDGIHYGDVGHAYMATLWDALDAA